MTGHRSLTELRPGSQAGPNDLITAPAMTEDPANDSIHELMESGRAATYCVVGRRLSGDRAP